MSATPSRIEYAPPPPWRRRRRFRRLLAFAPLLLALLAAPAWAPPLRRHLRVLAWQSQLMHWRPPPEQIVYAGGNNAIAQSAPHWDDYYTAVSPPGGRPGPTLFVHERLDPTGRRRLVEVSIPPPATGTSQALHAFAFTLRVLQPGSVLSRPRLLWQDLRFFPVPEGTTDHNVRIHAGQPDPANAAHFTITIETGSERTLLDGWLRDDNTVTIELRKPQ